MPRIDLPSGAWVEYRDKLMAGDRFAVGDALQVGIEVRPDGTQVQHVNGDVAERRRIRLLREIITAWSFPGIPIPAMNTATTEECLSSVLDLDDYQALADAVEPLLLAVTAAPKTSAARTGGAPGADTVPVTTT